jgi:hypothetical protein
VNYRRAVLDELEKLLLQASAGLNSGRARTSRYSARMALVTYSRAGLVIASTVR